MTSTGAPPRDALGALLEHVLQGEPELGGEVDAVFRDADRLRRRRTRKVLVIGAAAVGVIVVAGYLLTTTLLPARGAPAGAPTSAPRSAVVTPSAAADPVLLALVPLVDDKRLRIVPREPARGAGWRQYSVLDADGRPRGTIEIAIYAPSGRLCFPKSSGSGGCASPDRAGGGIEYVRYDDANDPNWQVNQTIARRTGDGRTVAVMATGERDAADPAAARPPLTGTQVQRIATDPGLIGSFGTRERCDGTAADDCPIFRVPVPIGK